MAGRRVDRLGMARGRSIAAAIIRRAEMRAALDHLARNPDVGLARVVAVLLAPAARILRNAAGLRRVGLVLRSTSRWSTPRHCRSCRGRRSRSAETPSPARCARSRRRRRFWRGNSPCQVLAMCLPPGVNSSPQAYSAPSSPPRAANSHSASVGKSLPAHRA